MLSSRERGHVCVCSVDESQCCMHGTFMRLSLVYWFCCLCLAVLDGEHRLTAEEMDERRQQNMAYEYLCHLEEAKR